MTELREIKECVGNYMVLDKHIDGYGLKSGHALVLQARRARGLKERGPNDQTVLCVFNTPKSLADLKTALGKATADKSQDIIKSRANKCISGLTNRNMGVMLGAGAWVDGTTTQLRWPYAT